MPEEILILFLFAMFGVFILSMTKMILSHRKGKSQAKSQSSESGSLTTSELEGMMRRAVEQALTGVSGKIEDLEIEVAKLNSSRPQLAAHDASTRLNLNDGELEDEVLDVTPVSARSKSNS